MRCRLCAKRKGKRACPARGAVICSQCCGTKRLVEIDCPPDCIYLTGAHAPRWEGRAAERERDERRLGPNVAGLTEGQLQLVLLSLVGVSGIRGRRPELEDAILLEAVAALRKTVETRQRGVLYEHPPGDARARELVHELGAMFEAREDDGTVRRPPDRDLAAALGGLERALAATIREKEGPQAFLDTAARLAGRLGGASPARPRPLIVEP
jgi:hypothetical protein